MHSVFVQTKLALHLGLKSLGLSILFCRLSEFHLENSPPIKGPPEMFMCRVWSLSPLVPLFPQRAVSPMISSWGAAASSFILSLPGLSSLNRFLPVPSHFLIIPTTALGQLLQPLKMQKSDFRPYRLAT